MTIHKLETPVELSDISLGLDFHLKEYKDYILTYKEKIKDFTLNQLLLELDTLQVDFEDTVNSMLVFNITREIMAVYDKLMENPIKYNTARYIKMLKELPDEVKELFKQLRAIADTKEVDLDEQFVDRKFADGIRAVTTEANDFLDNVK